MTKDSLAMVLVYFAFGFLACWWIMPSKTIKLPGQETLVYDFIRDTINTTDTVYFQTITEIPVYTHSVDTVYSDGEPIPVNLLKEYDRITDSLVSLQSARIKFFSKITADNDTIDIELESIRDSIIEFELKLAAREVLNSEIRTIYIPEEEAWYIHPGLITGGVVVGYLLGGVR